MLFKMISFSLSLLQSTKCCGFGGMAAAAAMGGGDCLIIPSGFTGTIAVGAMDALGNNYCGSKLGLGLANAPKSICSKFLTEKYLIMPEIRNPSNCL